MFEIGFWELALLAVLGLVVLGPEKLPKVASQVGRYAGQARRMARTLTTQIRDELEAEERRITARESTPPVTPNEETASEAPPAYNRPGAEDLIPRAPEEPPATQAGEATDESAETAHRPQP